jgi:A/G-specific adenine glycosylase
MKAQWKTLAGEARHTFTHFHLRLVVKTALVPMDRASKAGDFVPLQDFRVSDLPTVMRKVFDLASDAPKIGRMPSARSKTT